MKKTLIAVTCSILLIACNAKTDDESASEGNTSKADLLNSYKSVLESCSANVDAVCGMINGERVSYINKCYAKRNKATDIKEGWCEDNEESNE